MAFLPGGNRTGPTILCGILALLVSSKVCFSQAHVASRRPVRVIYLQNCRFPFVAPQFAPAPPLLLSPGVATTAPYIAPPFVPPSYTYLLVGSTSPARLPLVFKDGTSYTVSDYWRENDQLHYLTLEDGGAKSVPHTAPFDNLDQPRTKAAAEAQGLRFIIRDEPLSQWLDHRAQREPARVKNRKS